MDTEVEAARDSLAGTHVLHLQPASPRPGPGFPLEQYYHAVRSHPQWDRAPQRFRQLVLLRAQIHRRAEAGEDPALLRAEVQRMFERRDRALVAPGEMVGVIAAQSISERFTQSTLNSFHLAGSKKSAAQQGIRRIVEIFDAARALQLPYLRPVACEDPERLIARSLGDLADSHGIVWRPEEGCSWVIFFDIDAASRARLREARLPPELREPRARLTESGLEVLSPADSSLATVRSRVRRLARLHVLGVRNATEYDPADSTLYFRPGSNARDFELDELWEASGGKVDLRALRSNDVRMMPRHFGIEAARAALLSELQDVLAREGIRVNDRHLMLLVDNMTHDGGIRPNKYHGVDAEESIILKATFQQATETFGLAAANFLSDNLRDVSSQVLTGSLAEVGTARARLAPHELGPWPPRKRACPELAHRAYTAPQDYAPASPGPAFVPATEEDFLEPLLV